MNTRICYLYRDSDNYKVHNMCVIHGELTDSQIDQILECCDMGEYFIPSQVGLPERKFDEFDLERDHCWFELNRDGFESCNQEADTFLTAEQLQEIARDGSKVHGRPEDLMAQMAPDTLRILFPYQEEGEISFSTIPERLDNLDA